MPTQHVPAVGDLLDLTAWALVRWWQGTDQKHLRAVDVVPDAGGQWRLERAPGEPDWQIGLEWDAPRDVRQVVVEFADAVPPGLRVEYWRGVWPSPAPERWPGARRGWIGRDDAWHGQWTAVRAATVVTGRTVAITFDPVDFPELGGAAAVGQIEAAEDYLARFRRTLKLRLVCAGERQPVVARWEVTSGTRWATRDIDLHLGVTGEASADWSGQAEALNGYILAVLPLEAAAVADERGRSWIGQTAAGAACSVRLRVLYAACDRAAADHTLITVRTAARSFSFLVNDLDAGPIYLPDYGVFVRWAGAAPDFAQFQAELPARPRPLFERVDDEPEQSLARAQAEIPALDPAQQDSYTGLGLYLPLGVEAGRQEWALRYNGELFADKIQLKLTGRDAARLLWPGHQLRLRFATGDPPDFRERRDGTAQSLRDGWLPVVISRWLDREIEVEQTAFATLLDGSLTPPADRRGDEAVVALLRFAIRNTTPGRKRAQLWIALAPYEQLDVRPGGAIVARGRVVPAEPVDRAWRVQPYETDYLRCVVQTGGRGQLTPIPYAAGSEAPAAIPTAVLYTVELEEGETHCLDCAVPFPTLTDPAEWAQVAALDVAARLDDVVAYWTRSVDSGGLIDVPDRVLSDFHKAARVHVAITADKDPVSGLIALPAGTYSYGVCANEACWQITMLDQAGHHDRAAVYLETFLATQGVSELDGHFASREGVMQGLDFDAGRPYRSGFAYNLDHGVILECLAEHYRLTGDRAWLTRVAPQLVAACEFVIRERAATKVYAGPPSDRRRVAEWGLLPAGHLEDNPEWRHWFAVNAHAYRGLRGCADVLGAIGHPDAARLAREAEAYRADIRDAARRALVESPVVALRDGTYVPHVPTRTGIRGREWGWFREAAYGALHLLEGDVFEPDAEEMTWMLKDLEDNLYGSREWGRPVDVEREWFSHGGITIQPNLTDLGIDYLRRGQIKHALRALFNNFGVSLYPTVRAFSEHPVYALGRGVGPHYKSSDEAKALLWLRAFLVWEDGTALHLAPGAPRAWFALGETFGVRAMATHFGPLTYQVRSAADAVEIAVAVPERQPPQTLVIHVRLPEDQAIAAATVRGGLAVECDPHAETVRVEAPAGRLNIRVAVAPR